MVTQSLPILQICLVLTVALPKAQEGPQWDPWECQNDVRQFLAGNLRMTFKDSRKNDDFTHPFIVTLSFFVLPNEPN